MREYEVIVVFRSALDEEERGALLERILGWMNTDSEGANITHWGERKMAYDIRDESTGYYSLIEVAMDPANVLELDRSLRFVDGVLRFLIVRKEPLKVHEFDYKNVNVLQKYVTDHGHIVPRRRNRISAKQQRSLSTAIKRARHLAMMPFVVD